MSEHGTLAVYAYALCVVVLAVLAVLVAVTYRREMARARRAWVAAYALAFVVALPMLLFVLKNQVLGGATLPGEGLLPFTLHPLTEVRTGLDPVSNLRFVATGFDDGRAWNSPPGVRPLMLVALLLVPVGAVALWRHRVDGLRSPFLLWLAAASTLLVTVTLNDNRANALLVPVVVAAACGLDEVVRRLARARVAHVVTGALLALVVVDALLSWRAYFSPEQQERFEQAFDVGFGPAVRAASEIEVDLPVLVTDVAIADAQVMFHLDVAPDDLPAGRTPTEPDFDRWVFDASRLPAGAYLAVARTTTPSVPDQPLPDDCDADTPAWSEGGWVVLRCGDVGP